MPQWMVWVFSYLEEGALDPAQYLLMDPVVHHFRHPPGAFLPNLLPDQLLVLGHQPGETVDHPVEQLLVPVVDGEEGKSLGEHRGNRHLPERLDHSTVQQGVDVLVSDHV